VMSRVARASLPCSVRVSVSCLTYCEYQHRNELECEVNYWKGHTRHSVFSRTTTRSTVGFCPGSADTCLTEGIET
jgi:hypothetical protein